MTVKETVNGTPEIVKVIVGGMVTLFVSVSVYFITDYNRLREAEESRIAKEIADEKIKELKEITKDIESKLIDEIAYRKIYKERVLQSVDSLMKATAKGKDITQEILEHTIKNPNDIPKEEREEIYHELEIHRIP